MDAPENDGADVARPMSAMLDAFGLMMAPTDDRD
jgi:hypothetical protein